MRVKNRDLGSHFSQGLLLQIHRFLLIFPSSYVEPPCWIERNSTIGHVASEIPEVKIKNIKPVIRHIVFLGEEVSLNSKTDIVEKTSKE